jgi:hypothetical protein
MRPIYYENIEINQNNTNFQIENSGSFYVILSLIGTFVLIFTRKVCSNYNNQSNDIPIDNNSIKDSEIISSLSSNSSNIISDDELPSYNEVVKEY